MIRYKDLSPWLKVLVVFGWIAFGICVISFFVGFYKGLIETAIGIVG